MTDHHDTSRFSSTDIDAYIRTVCNQVRCKEVHPDIREELQGHFEDLIADLQANNGQSFTESVEAAISHMGNAEDVGKKLNRSHRNRVDWPLLGFLLALMALGITVQLSIFTIPGHVPGTYMTSFTQEAIGILLAIGCFFIDFRKLARFSWVIYAVMILFMVFTAVGGVRIDGSKYFGLSPVPIDIFGISPFVLVIALAGFLRKMNWSRPSSLMKAMVLFLIPLSIYIPGNANAHAIEYTMGFIGVLLASRPGLKRVFGIAGICVACICAAYFFRMTHGSPWLFGRFTGFIHPRIHAQAAGYWYVEAQQAVASVNLWGHGFGTANWKMPDSGLYLTFSYLLYAFGWGSALLALSAVAGLLYRMVRTIRRANHDYGSILATGILTVLAFKFIYAIIMGFGVIPIVGIHMPFVSPAPGEFAIEVVTIGLLMSVYRMKNRMSGLATQSKKGVTTE